MSSSLLKGDGDKEYVKPSLMYSARSFLSVIGQNGILQIACIKSVSDEPGGPKAKHMEIIVDILCKQPSEFENVLLAYDALTNWQEKKIVALKIMCALIQLFQKVPDIVASHKENLNLLYSKIRDMWMEQEPLIHEMTLFLTNKICLMDYSAYQLFFDTQSAAAKGVTLATVDAIEKCTVLSALFSCQDILMRVLTTLKDLKRNGIRSGVAGGRNFDEITTCINLRPTLFSECNSIFIAETSLLRLISKHSSAKISPQLVAVLTEQYDAQYAVLSTHLGNSASTGEDDDDEVHALHFPRINPLLAERVTFSV